MAEQRLRDLVGGHVLSGIEVGRMLMDVCSLQEMCNYIKFTIDGVTLLAAEDPDDGYRSYMRDLAIVEEPCKIDLPDIRVCCTMRPDCWWGKNEVLSFIDVLSGKEILAVGTENTSDYYPCCILEYHPENMYCNMEGGVKKADMRLIDANALFRCIVAEENEIITDNFHAIGLHNGLTLAQAMVINAPTVDAVPVVRCKDCKRFVDNREARVTYCNKELEMLYARPEDFCSHGERRDDGSL